MKIKINKRNLINILENEGILDTLSDKMHQLFSSDATQAHHTKYGWLSDHDRKLKLEKEVTQKYGTSGVNLFRISKSVR